MRIFNIEPDDMYLYNQIACCISKYRDLLLSYSGGLDSTVLLDILSNFIQYIDFFNNLLKISSFSLRVVYVHHGLNKYADCWADHCAQQCRIRNIPFQTLYLNKNHFNKKLSNIESNARKLRYQILYDYLKLNEVLLTAHHMDDQIETVLLALKRGSGPTGLSGMSKDVLLYKHCNHHLLRPLLECSRAQLQQYADRKKLIWVTDNTNMDVRFDRNFLREHIVPLLKARWPFFIKSVVRSAQLCKNQENLLQELLSESLSKLIDLDGSLFFYPLFRYSVLKRQMVLRYWLGKFCINMPSYQLLNNIWNEIVLSKPDAKPVVHVDKQYMCCRFRKKLYIVPISLKSVLNPVKLFWQSLNDVLLLPNKLGLLVSESVAMDVFGTNQEANLHSNSSVLNSISLNFFQEFRRILTNCLVRSPLCNEKVFIRFGSVSEILYIVNRDRGRKLKKIWQEYNIPPWFRSCIPLLFYNNVLIAALGVFITRDGFYKTNINQTEYNHRYTAIRSQRIIWLQNNYYHKLFKSIVHKFLK